MRVIRVRQVGWLVLALACMVAAGAFRSPLAEQSREHELYIESTNMGDVAAIQILPGGLRALAFNYVWLQSQEKHQAGRHYDARQLAELACKLMPSFPGVWSFHSWNMAWNISVATHTPDERWKWVYNGVRLVRDRGIVYNPRSNWLYRQIAWTFFNKMGEWTDDMHRCYKRQWAIRMQHVLGPRPPGATTERVLAAFKPIAEAPETVRAFLDADPKNAELVAAVRAFGMPLDDEISLNESVAAATLHLHSVDQFMARYWRAVRGKEATLANLQVGTPAPSDATTEAMKAFLAGIDPPERRDRLVAFIQAFILRNRYQLDPGLMYELMEAYGPFDWRTVESQGIYWTILGTRRSPKWEIDDELDRLNTERVLLYALRNLSRRGWLVFEPNYNDINRSYFNQVPDLRFIDVTHELYIALGKRYNATPHWRAEGGGQYLGSGHQFFLHEAVRQLYFNGEEERAAFYYTWLRKNFRNPDTVTIKKMYTKPLWEFVVAEARGQIDIFRGTSDTINGLMYQAYFRLATGEADRFAKCVKQAQRLWDQYMVHRLPDDTPRRQLPDFWRMARDQLGVFLRMPGVGVVGKARMWQRLPVSYKREAWDRVAPMLQIMCKRASPPIDFAKAFPEPPGMGAYREAHPTRADTVLPEDQKQDRIIPKTQPAVPLLPE